MQLEITDDAAITFACELYAALADGYAIDAALAEARKAIFADAERGRVGDAGALHARARRPDLRRRGADRRAPARRRARGDDPHGASTRSRGRARARVEPEPPVAHAAVRALRAGSSSASPRAHTVLAVAVAYPWDNHMAWGRSFVTPYFGSGGSLPNGQGGFFVALSPLVVVLALHGARGRARRPRAAPAARGRPDPRVRRRGLGQVPRRARADLRHTRGSAPTARCSSGSPSPRRSRSSSSASRSPRSRASASDAASRPGGRRPSGLLVALSGLLVLVACLVPYNGATGYTSSATSGRSRSTRSPSGSRCSSSSVCLPLPPARCSPPGS